MLRAAKRNWPLRMAPKPHIRYISTKGLRFLSSADNPKNAASTTSSGTSSTIGRFSPAFGSPTNHRGLNFDYEGPRRIEQNKSFEPFHLSHLVAINQAEKTRNMVHLSSMLEACLCSGYIERSYAILKSLHACNNYNFIDYYNMYLSAYLEKQIPNGINDIYEANYKLHNDLESVFADRKYNDRTLAIIIHFALKLKPDIEIDQFKKIIENYFIMSDNSKFNILKNDDLLTLDDYGLLVNELHVANPQDIPVGIQKILSDKHIKDNNSNSNNEPEINNEQVSNTTMNEMSIEKIKLKDNESTWDLNDSVASLDKNAKELVAVNTIGIKVVRHGLLGLTLSDSQKKTLLNFINKNGLDISIDINSPSIDFFEISKLLKSEEEQKTFNEILEDFNEDRQKILETRTTEAARERWMHDFYEAKERGDTPIEKGLNAKLWEWYSELLPLVKKEVDRCKHELSSNSLYTKLDYAPFFVLVDPGKMCAITILELLKLNSTGGVIEGMRTARAVLSVGKSIELEFRSEKLLKNERRSFKDVSKKPHALKKYVRSAKKKLRNLHIEQSKIEWPVPIKAKIGSIIISNLIHIAKVHVKGFDPKSNTTVYGEVPAFSHTYQYHNGIKLGVLKIHKSLITQLNGERVSASVQSQHLPMVVKPRKWRSWNSGGYHYSQSTLVRSKESPEQIAYLKAVSREKMIPTIYNGLNVIGDTPWTVNRKMYNVISEVWNTKQEFLDIPSASRELHLLPKPSDNAEPEEIRDWKLKNKEILNKYSGDRSVRCDLNYKLEIARGFLGEKMYFPHNLDFRGRAYPLSPHFNHLGNDLSRGLLLFWNGKKLGERGLLWLKVHLANLYGFDKASFSDRIIFTDNHLNEIKDSAENPLNGKGWWKNADKPWQTLAGCIELNEALKLNNPEDFVSHQAIYQDGTCNGLQHYAALGGDVEGARQVNLIPSDKPQDVYSHVAKLVEKRLELAAEEGDEIAKTLKGRITRSVVKQTVMTNVYGVTYIGATFQIAKQLKEQFDDKTIIMEYSQYLARHVFAAIRESFKGAHAIQDWLGECSKRISRSIKLDVNEKSFKNGNRPDFMSSVIWTTPLGLPIVQPYRDKSRKQIRTNLQTIFLTDPLAVNPVNARRQKSGFPPNFIHSLDASHMLLSASKCGERGLDFASVHDSYWTHACDVDTLSKLLRDEFIRLHEVDLIERLKTEFDQRYKDYLEVRQIPRGTDIAKRIVEARHQLSKKLGRTVTLADEIASERERRRLIASQNPEDVKLAESMMTTVSIGEELNNIKFSEEDLKKGTKLSVLIPLILPPIPPKGQFDVQELRESEYFFS